MSYPDARIDTPKQTIQTFEDVVAAILPLAPTLSEGDIKDILLTVAGDPTSGPAILDAYKAANVVNGPDVWAEIWDVIQTASNVAGIITSIGGAAAML